MTGTLRIGAASGHLAFLQSSTRPLFTSQNANVLALRLVGGRVECEGGHCAIA